MICCLCLLILFVSLNNNNTNSSSSNSNSNSRSTLRLYDYSCSNVIMMTKILTASAAILCAIFHSTNVVNAQTIPLPTTTPKATWGLFLSGLPTYPPLPTPFPGFYPWFPSETYTIPYPRPGVNLLPTRVQLPSSPYGWPFPVERLGGLEFIGPLGGRAFFGGNIMPGSIDPWGWLPFGTSPIARNWAAPFSGGGSYGFPFASDINALFPGDDLVEQIREAATPLSDAPPLRVGTNTQIPIWQPGLTAQGSPLTSGLFGGGGNK